MIIRTNLHASFWVALSIFAGAAIPGCATSQRAPQPPTAAPEAALDISLAHGTPREVGTRAQLQQLLAANDLRPWLFTRKVIIDEESIPHSHPVLTLHARHLAHDDQLLSTFLHEQIHWFLETRDAQTAAATADLHALFPALPVGFPEGADSERSSYEHLLVIYLELEGLIQLIGDSRANDVFQFWEGDHYRALYRTVREGHDAVAHTVAQNDLLPTFLHVVIARPKLFDREPDAADDFPRAAPDAVDPGALDRLVRQAEATHSDSLLVLKDGKVVCERYLGGRGGPLETMSVTKSFVSLAIGYLLAEGKIPSLDVPLSHYFPEWSKGLKSKVTLRHVLTHTSGVEHRPAAGILGRQEDRLAYVRSLAVVDEPGSKFSYNNEAVQLLSGIIATAAQKPVDTYLDEKLFAPLGIHEWTWAKDKKGNVATFYGLSLAARDLAKAGFTLLEGGRFRDREIVPADWVRLSTKPASSDVSQVGFLWWMEPATGTAPPIGFRADGWLGQYIVVYPELGLVGVRQHREAEGGGDEKENETYGFRAFPKLLRQLNLPSAGTRPTPG